MEIVNDKNSINSQFYTIYNVISYFKKNYNEKLNELSLNFKNLSNWYERISSRDAVKKGYDLLKKGEQVPGI